MLVMSKPVYHITDRTQTKAHVAHVPISLAFVDNIHLSIHNETPPEIR